MNESTNPAARTVNQLWQDTQLMTLMFNDELPNGTLGPTGKAHQKGVIGFQASSNTGFYLMHSTPGWAKTIDTPNIYDSDIYGQHFFCVSFNQTQLETLGKHMYVTRPFIYQNTFSLSNATYPYFYSVINLLYNSTNSTIYQKLYSNGGQEFDLIAKNCQASSQLWSQVSDFFNNSFKVETWLRDSSSVPDCLGNKVELIGTLKFCSNGTNCTTFIETQDHSKWGVN